MVASPDEELLEEARDRDGVELREAMVYHRGRVKAGREPGGAVMMQCDCAAR